jgi:putative flavoprotein involved in K+ transport
MTESLETVIVGGGQAGLSVSYCLARRQREHVVLEQAAQAGNVWRNERWDSFTLVTPNWSLRLPGAEYRGDEPNGFMPRAGVVDYLEQYASGNRLPVRFGVRVVEVTPQEKGYLVTTEDGSYQANNVIMATGLFQQAKIPPFGTSIPADILQLVSGQYRNPQSLPPGAVMVVGTGQSGAQIAEELYQSGRKVYLCTGSAGRVPRRYRGKDIFEWMLLTKFFHRTADMLPSPRAKFAGNPHVTGKNGGHTLNLHQFAHDGVTLLGRFHEVHDGSAYFAPDLNDNLARADRFEAEMIKRVDDYIADNRLDAPEDNLPDLHNGYKITEVSSLDLKSAGIGAVIWALGFHFDYSLVKLPVVDSDGYPLQKRGVTAYPGLYFVGMPFLSAQKSGLFVGVGEDAEYIAGRIVGEASA